MSESSYGPFEVYASVDDAGDVRLSTGDAQEALEGQLTRRSLNTLAQRKFFVYMDVGRWGGNQLNFGLVFGDGKRSEILLCEYCPKGGAPLDRYHFPYPIESLLNSEQLKRKVKILRRTCFGPALGLNTNDKVYLLLGDLHVPVIRKPPVNTIDDVRGLWHRSTAKTILQNTVEAVGEEALKKTARETIAEFKYKWLLGLSEKKRNELVDAARLVSPVLVQKRLELTDPANDAIWWGLYMDGDIFGDAGESLSRFLAGLESFLRTAQPDFKVHLVQVGDLYELWIGLQRFFGKAADHEVRIPGGDTGMAVIRHWITVTHRNNPVSDGGSKGSLLDRLHNCGVDEKTWISGNHDNYLLAVAGKPGDPPRRVEHLFENGIQIEHGHRADPMNRDGAIEGHAITQLVFVEKILRQGDPDRRPLYLRYSTKKFAESKGKLKLFVMAHTHAPYLAPVYVNARTQ